MFRRQHPHPDLIMIVDDYVPPATIQQTFTNARLTHYVATLKPQMPLAAMGDVVKSGHRLLVFAREQGGAPS